MKYIDALKQNNQPLISLEIIPPGRGCKIDDIFSCVEKLLKFEPKFINVTNHEAHKVYEEIEGKICQIPKNKRPGTVGVAMAIKNKFNIESIPHLICGGVNKYDIEDELIELNYLGINNVFVVRGDPLPGTRQFSPPKDGHKYASELVKQISGMNRGKYIIPGEDQTPTDFCIGVAGYPEKHYEALNLDSDLLFLKKKVEDGADYIITQMFFNFDSYKNFVNKVRSAGINIPIIPGIKPITSAQVLKTIPRAFYINIPEELIKKLEEAKTPEEEFRAGTLYMSDLVKKLIEFGAPAIHVFTFGQGKSAYALLKQIYS